MKKLLTLTSVLFTPALLISQSGLDPTDIWKPLKDQWTSYSGDLTGKRYSALKGAVADAVVDALAPIQARYAEIRADEEGLLRLLADSAARVRIVADATLLRVQEAVGLR